MTDLVKSFTFGEDIAEKTAVKLSQEGVVVKADDKAVLGIALYAGAQGATGDVQLNGLSLVQTKGAVVAGDYLVADENGALKALDMTTLSQGDIKVIVGTSLETATDDAMLWAVINPVPVVFAEPIANSEE